VELQRCYVWIGARGRHRPGGMRIRESKVGRNVGAGVCIKAVQHFLRVRAAFSVRSHYGIGMIMRCGRTKRRSRRYANSTPPRPLSYCRSATPRLISYPKSSHFSTINKIYFFKISDAVLRILQEHTAHSCSSKKLTLKSC
jgi:hypothetical protein